MNEQFSKVKNKSFKTLIFLSCILGIGILLLLAGVLVLALAKIMALAIPLIIIGIACALVGMYGAPSAKLNYKTYIKYEEFVRLVNEEGITDAEILMDKLNMSVDAFNKMVNYCNNKNLLEKEVVEIKEEKKEDKIICPKCGAELDYTGKEKFCPICGAALEGEENE